MALVLVLVLPPVGVGVGVPLPVPVLPALLRMLLCLSWSSSFLDGVENFDPDISSCLFLWRIGSMVARKKILCYFVQVFVEVGRYVCICVWCCVCGWLCVCCEFICFFFVCGCVCGSGGWVCEQKMKMKRTERTGGGI